MGQNTLLALCLCERNMFRCAKRSAATVAVPPSGDRSWSEEDNHVGQSSLCKARAWGSRGGREAGGSQRAVVGYTMIYSALRTQPLPKTHLQSSLQICTKSRFSSTNRGDNIGMSHVRLTHHARLSARGIFGFIKRRGVQQVRSSPASQAPKKWLCTSSL